MTTEHERKAQYVERLRELRRDRRKTRVKAAVPWVLWSIFVTAMFVLATFTAYLFGWGNGVDWQRNYDHMQICRAYPTPASITGFACKGDD